MPPLTKMRWLIMYFLLCSLSVPPVEAADEGTGGKYPWSAEAALIVGRALAIRHVLGAGGAGSSPRMESSSAVASASDQGLLLGGGAVAFAGSQSGDQLWEMATRIQEQQWRLAQMWDPMLSRVQQQQLLSQMQAQQWRLVSRIQHQQWKTSLMGDQMFSRIQQQQWKAILRQDQMLSRMQRHQYDLVLRQQMSGNLLAAAADLQARQTAHLAFVGVGGFALRGNALAALILGGRGVLNVGRGIGAGNDFIGVVSQMVEAGYPGGRLAGFSRGVGIISTAIGMRDDWRATLRLQIVRNDPISFSLDPYTSTRGMQTTILSSSQRTTMINTTTREIRSPGLR